MPTDNGATDVHGAAAQLSALIQSEQSLPTEDESDAQEEQQTKPVSNTQETLESDTDGEKEERYKVKTEDGELEVTLDDLKKGYMMEANYRRKTMSLSKEREAVEKKAAEIDQQLSEARSLIDEEINSLNSEEMQALKEENPDEYIRRQDKIQSKMKKYEELQTKRAKENQERQNRLISKEREALFDLFPDWKNDQSKMNEESSKLMKVMESFGFTQQELQSMTDHRMFVLAHKVQQFETLQKTKLEAKEVKAKPKNTKPGTPKDEADRKSASTKAKWEELKKTGSRHAAIDLLSSR